MNRIVPRLRSTVPTLAGAAIRVITVILLVFVSVGAFHVNASAQPVPAPAPSPGNGTPEGNDGDATGPSEEEQRAADEADRRRAQLPNAGGNTPGTPIAPAQPTVDPNTGGVPQNAFAAQCEGKAEVDDDHKNGAFGGLAAVSGCSGVQAMQWTLLKLGFGSPEDPGARYMRTETDFSGKIDNVTNGSPLNFLGVGEGGRWFITKYSLMREIMLKSLIPLILLGTIHAIVARSLQMLFRVYVIGIPVALVGSIAMITFVQVLAAATDEISAPFIAATKTNATTFYSLIASGFGASGAMSGINMMAQTMFGFMLTVTSMFLYFILMMRDAAVYLSAIFLPLGLALFIWPATAKYFVKMFQFIVAMIVSKFVMIATLSLGLAALVGDAGGQTQAPTIAVDGATVVGQPADRVYNEKLVNSWAWHSAVAENILLFLLLAWAPNATAKVFMSVGFGQAANALPGSLSRPGLMVKIVGTERAMTSFRLGWTEANRLKKETRRRKRAARTTSEARVFMENTWGVRQYSSREIDDDPTIDRFDPIIPKKQLDDLGWDGSGEVEEELYPGRRDEILETRRKIEEWMASGDLNRVGAAQIIANAGAGNVRSARVVDDDPYATRVEVQFMDKEVMVILDGFESNDKIVQWVDVKDTKGIAREHARRGERVAFLTPIQMLPGSGGRKFRPGSTRDGTLDARMRSSGERNAAKLMQAFQEVEQEFGSAVRLEYKVHETLEAAGTISRSQFGDSRMFVRG